MQKTLLDTDILSEILKGKNAAVERAATAYRATFGSYTTSAITVMEIVKGLQRAGRPERIAPILGGLASEEVLPFDADTAVIAGRMYGELERSGQSIGRADPMIAAIAVRHGLQLATGNTQHFERIVRLGFPLALVDWRA